MSEPIELILNQHHQSLKLFCGNCGDSVELIFDITEDKKINITIQDSVDRTVESEDKEFFLSPIELIV